MLVPGRALVDALVLLSLHPADVDYQRPRVGLHGHVGVVADIEVGAVPRPGETEGRKAERITAPLVFTGDRGCYDHLAYKGGAERRLKKRKLSGRSTGLNMCLCPRADPFYC